MKKFRHIFNIILTVVNSVKNLSLIKKVILFSTPIFIIFLLIFGYITEKILENQIIDNLKVSAKILVEKEAKSINSHFGQLENLGEKSSKIIAGWLDKKVPVNQNEFSRRHKKINGALRTDTSAYADKDISAVFLSNRSVLTEEIKFMIQATEDKFDNYAKAVKPTVFNMYLITKDQLIRIYEKNWSLEIEPDHDFTKDIFYYIGEPEYNPEKKPKWTQPYYDAIWKHWMTSLITPVYLNDQFIGIVGHDVILDEIYSNILNKQYFNSGYGFIFDSSKNIIVHPKHLSKLLEKASMGTLLGSNDLFNDPVTTAISGIIEEAEPVNQISIKTYKNEDDTHFLFAHKLDMLNWYFAIDIPDSEILRALPAFRQDFTLGAVMLISLIFVIFMGITWLSVIVPIKRLTRVTNEIRMGNYEKKVKAGGHDEIGQLSTSFNAMISRINEQMHEVKEAEENLRSIFDNSLEGIIQTTVDGRFLTANTAAARIFGFDSPDELTAVIHDIGTQLYADPQQRKELLEKLLKEKYVEGYEIQAFKKDRTKIWISMNLRSVCDQYGNIIFLEGFLKDITDHKKNEDTLQYLNTLLLTQLETSIDAILVVDDNFNVVLHNKQFEDLWRVPGELIKNKTSVELRELLLDRLAHPAKFKDEIQTIYSNQKRKSFDEIEFKDGSIIERYSNPLNSFDGKNYGRVWYFRDISEKRKAQQALIEAKEKAERSEKLKSEFLAQMSHEIRTPINAILSFSTLIREEMEDKVDEDLRTSFTSISNAGRRIIRTIDLILNMSEIQSGSFECIYKTFDIYENVVLNTFAEYKSLAKEKGLELHLQKNTNNTIVFADEYTVSQIIQNLLDNAIKYTLKGKVELSVNRNGDEKLMVSVSDTGIGISDEYLPYLFTAFSQEEQGYSRKFEGNGLGLALVNKYCKMNNATIEIFSKKNVGTTFVVTFLS